MSSKDMRRQIPIGCAVNFAIISELSKTELFNEYCINVPKKYNLKPLKENEPWPFFNISWGAYVMYCMFVVSREIYNINNEDSYFTQLKLKNAFNDFEILKERNSFNDNPLYVFKSLRNSISHVNYKMENEIIEFWDHPPQKKKPKDWHWHVKITQQNFMTFLGLVNDANFKFYNEINKGLRNYDGTEK